MSRWSPVLLLLVGLSSPAQAEEHSRGPADLRRLEQQHDALDFPGAIETARVLLARGGNDPTQLARIYEIAGQCLIVTGDEEGAEEHFRRLLALRPDYQLGEDVSPKIRRPLTRVLARWAGRPGLTVVHGPPAWAPFHRALDLQVRIVEDPVRMVHRLRLSYRLPGTDRARVMEAKAALGENRVSLPLAKLAARAGPLRYVLEVLDRDNNVLVRRGTEASPLSIELRPPPPAPLPGAAPDQAENVEARLQQQLVARRQSHRRKTLWGSITLGTGLACVATAAILYGVGGAQGSEAYDNYKASYTDADLLRYGDEVDAAKGKLTAGHVLISVGVAAIASAIYLFVTRPTAREPLR